MNYEQFRYPALYQSIIESLYNPQVFRNFFFQWFSPDNDLLEFPIEQGNTAIKCNRVEEGAEAVIEEIIYGRQTIKMYKYGEGLSVTDEDTRFHKIPAVAFKPRKLGNKIGNTIDLDCRDVVDAGVPATHVISATGQTVASDVVTRTLSNTVGLKDLNRGKEVIRRNGRIDPRHLVVNAEGLNHFDNLPQFNAFNLYGDPAYMTGKRGTYLGLDVHLTENCPDGTMYMIAPGGQSFSGQFAPYGFFGYAYDIRTRTQSNGKRDQEELYAYSMFAPVVTKGVNSAKISYNPTPYE